MPSSAADFFVIGALAKMAATVATYPLQVAQALVYSSKTGEGMAKCLASVRSTSILCRPPLFHPTLRVVQVWAANGFMGLYRGMAAKLSQTVLNAALMFLFYEKLNYFILRALAGA